MECQLEKKSLNSNTASLDHRSEPLIKRNKGPKIGDLLKKRKLRDQSFGSKNSDDEEDDFDRERHTKQECINQKSKQRKIQIISQNAEKNFSFELYQQQYDLKDGDKNKSYKAYSAKFIQSKKSVFDVQKTLESQKKMKLDDQSCKSSSEKDSSSEKQVFLYDICHTLAKDHNGDRDENDEKQSQGSDQSDDSENIEDQDKSNMDEEIYKLLVDDQYQTYEDATKRKKKVKKSLNHSEKYMELQKAAFKNSTQRFPIQKKKFKKGVLMSKQMYLQQSQQDNQSTMIQNSQINVGNNFTIHSNIQSLNPQMQSHLQTQNQQPAQHHTHNMQQYQNYPQYQQDVIMHDQGPEYLQKKIRLLDGCNKYLDRISWEAPEEELDKMEKEFRQSQLKPEQTISQLNNSHKRTIIQDKKFEKVYKSLRKAVKWTEQIFDDNSMVFNKMLVELNLESQLYKDDFNTLNTYKIQLATPFNEQNLIDKKKNEQILEFFMQENNFVMDRSQIRDISTFKGNQHGQQQQVVQINQHKIYQTNQTPIQHQQNQGQHIPSQFNTQAKQVELRATFGQQQQQQQVMMGGQQNLLHYQRINQTDQQEQIHTLPFHQEINNTVNQIKFDGQLKNPITNNQIQNQQQSQILNIPSDQQQQSQHHSAQNIVKKNKTNLQSQSYNFHHYIKYFKNNQFSNGGNSSSHNLVYQNSKFAGGKNDIIVIDSPKRCQNQQQQQVLSQHQNTQINQESNQTFSKECHAQTINTGQNQFDSNFLQNTQLNLFSQQVYNQHQSQLQQQSQQQLQVAQQKSQLVGFNSANILDQPQNQHQKINSGQLVQTQGQFNQTNQQQQLLQQQQNNFSQNQQQQQLQQVSGQLNGQKNQQNVLGSLAINQYPLLNQFGKVNYMPYNTYAIATQLMQTQIAAVNNHYTQYFTSSSNTPATQSIQLQQQQSQQQSSQIPISQQQPSQSTTQQQQQQQQQQPQQQLQQQTQQPWSLGQLNPQSIIQQQSKQQAITNTITGQQQPQLQNLNEQQINSQIQANTTFLNAQNPQLYFQMNLNSQQLHQLSQQINSNQHQQQQQQDGVYQQSQPQQTLLDQNQLNIFSQQQVLNQNNQTDEITNDPYSTLFQNSKLTNQKIQSHQLPNNNISSTLNNNPATVQSQFNGIQTIANFTNNNNGNGNNNNALINNSIQQASNQNAQNQLYLLMNQANANQKTNTLTNTNLQQQSQQQQILQNQQQQQSNQLYLLMQQQQQNNIQNPYQMFMLPKQVIPNQTLIEATKLQQQTNIQLTSANTNTATTTTLLPNQFILNNSITQNQII